MEVSWSWHKWSDLFGDSERSTASYVSVRINVPVFLYGILIGYVVNAVQLKNFIKIMWVQSEQLLMLMNSGVFISTNFNEICIKLFLLHYEKLPTALYWHF